MEHPLRLVECLDSEGNRVMMITSDFHLDAVEISELYRNRWQIELFFKWIKQHLHVKKCYGTSKHAVYNQIRLALITFCLTLFMQKNVDHKGSLLGVFKHLRLCWDEAFSAFILALFHPPSRRSRGRQKMNHERIIGETLWQFESREAAHLDCLTYDPII